MDKRERNQVYGLYCTCGCDPERTIRYVGQSSLGARDRLNKHRYSARNGKPWPVTRWMAKHGPDNIQVQVLESFDNPDPLDRAEEKWITNLGTDISLGGYNLAPGGKSVRGYRHAPDALSRKKGPKHSAETRRRISEAVRGRFGETAGNVKLTDAKVADLKLRMMSGETDLSISRDLGMSTASINYIRQGRTWAHIPWPDVERVPSPTGRYEPGSLPPSTKLNPEKIREIRERYERGDKPKEIAPDFGVTPENIRMIVTRKTWKHVQ